MKKIFKSFPDRQNFKIFPQRAYKHLQNTKKYVIINKLISITIKNGLMVKRLRRCPLTAESAVRFRMGLPKKETTPLVVLFLFFSTPLSGNDAATCLPSFVNLRKQILAEELRFTRVKSFRKSMQTETATSAWGYVLLRCVKRRGNLFAVVRICVSKFCRRLPSPALLLSCQLHMGNGNFRMGLHTSSLRGNDAATCLPSFVFASANFAVVLRFTEAKKIRKGMQTETAISAWGYILLRCAETTRQLACRRSYLRQQILP